MNCPYCTEPDSKVVDSRPTEEGSTIRRRRECLSCERRFTTYETIERIPLMVVKKNGGREKFNRDKFLNSLLHATDKRSVQVERLEKVVGDIEQELQNRLVREIPSSHLGELALRHLKDIDEVSYIRFASVYKQFTDVKTFIAEVNSLLEDNIQ